VAEKRLFDGCRKRRLKFPNSAKRSNTVAFKLYRPGGAAPFTGVRPTEGARISQRETNIRNDRHLLNVDVSQFFRA